MHPGPIGTVPVPPLGGTGTCAITVKAGILFARSSWNTIPSLEELTSHCRQHGIFSPRPFRLAQPPDPASLACTAALAAKCCHYLGLSTRCLAKLFTNDPRVYDLASANQLAESETYCMPRTWGITNVQRLRIHLVAHGAEQAATAIESTHQHRRRHSRRSSREQDAKQHS
jgi:hypothetical protein